MPDDTPGEHRVTTDRNTIQEWAEEHDLVPVRETEGDETTTRFVPRSEMEEGSRMDWDEFHTDLGERNHVVVHEEDAEGHPLGVYDRETAVSRTGLDRDALEESLVEGEVVTGEITETRVVETTVVERAELESELIDTDVVDERVVDVELESRECTSCDLVAAEGAEETGWFDADRYLEFRASDAAVSDQDVDVASAPYTAELRVEDRYRVTRELTERFTIETRIADTDVTEMDTLASEDVDVEGLHQSIVESDLFRREDAADERTGVDADERTSVDTDDRTHVVAEEDLETEFVEGDRIHTFVDRTVTVEDDVVDRKRVLADITDVPEHETEIVESRGTETTTTSEFDAEGRTIEHDTGETAPARETETGTTSTTAGRTETDAGETATAAGDDYRTAPTEADEGKDVVDAAGDDVGMIVEVDEDSGIAYVDPHPGIADRIKATLDMGDADDEDFPLREDRIDRIDDDQVVLSEGPDVDEDTRT